MIGLPPFLSLHDADSPPARAIGSVFKGKISVVGYALGIGPTWVKPGSGIDFYASAARMWLTPRPTHRETLDG